MPRWLCHWMVWLRGADLPLGYAGFFDGNGGMRVAWAWHLRMDLMDLTDLMDKAGAPLYTPRGCCAVG